MGMIRKGRKRLRATSGWPYSQRGVRKERLGSTVDSGATTPPHGPRHVNHVNHFPMGSVYCLSKQPRGVASWAWLVPMSACRIGRKAPMRLAPRKSTQA